MTDERRSLSDVRIEDRRRGRYVDIPLACPRNRERYITTLSDRQCLLTTQSGHPPAPVVEVDVACKPCRRSASKIVDGEDTGVLHCKLPKLVAESLINLDLLMFRAE